MDASSKIQRSIHDVRLTYKYVSRILGTYQLVKKMRAAFKLLSHQICQICGVLCYSVAQIQQYHRGS